jgi:hypothetical protein
VTTWWGVPAGEACRACGASAAEHEHFHARTYCGRTGCPSYRRPWWWDRAGWAIGRWWFRQGMAAQDPPVVPRHRVINGKAEPPDGGWF